MTRTLRGAVLVVLLVAGLWLAASGPGSRAPARESLVPGVPTPAAVVTGVIPSTPLPSSRMSAATQREPRPPADAARAAMTHGSLRGAQPDGSVAFGADGALRIDRALRRRFDWYLSLVGEVDVAAIRALVAEDFRREFGAPRAQELLAWFDRYVDYQHAITEAPALPGAAGRLAWLQQQRQHAFGADIAQAWFGDEEAEAQAWLRRSSGDAEAQAMAHLDPAQAPTRLAELSRQLQATGADGATRHAQRAAEWGDDAAARLEALDQERLAWQQRIGTYQRAAIAIRADQTLDAAQQQRALAQLRAASFDANERRRVEALEAIGQLTPSG